MDGTEMANAVYVNHIDAAINFCTIARQMTKYNDEADIKIEDVVNSMEGEGRGMYAGVPGFVIVISKCDGGCRSPVWN
jgi:hypothetical protein